MQLAQLSDLHILDLESVRPSDFLSKRLTGGANLLTKRRNAHPIELTERLIADVSDQQLDHVVVTGDVTNLSLPGEFQRASRLLRLLGGYEKLTVVPGNHDIYTQGAANQRRFESYFGELLFGESSQPQDWIFPAVKDLGEVVLVGLCSAFPTPLFTAYGRVGDAQLSRAEAALSDPRFAGHTKIVLLHHNLHARTGLSEVTASLRDRGEVLSRLLAAGVDMVLHGHTHASHRFTVSRDHHDMLVIGSGSSTWASRNPDHAARYNIYTIEGGLKRVRTRVYDAARRRFEWMV